MSESSPQSSLRCANPSNPHIIPNSSHSERNPLYVPLAQRGVEAKQVTLLKMIEYLFSSYLFFLLDTFLARCYWLFPCIKGIKGREDITKFTKHCPAELDLVVLFAQNSNVAAY